MANKRNFKDIVNEINEKWNNKFEILEDIDTFEYKNVHQHISIKCRDCGKIYDRTNDTGKRINDLLHGYGCNRCAGTERHTNQEWKDIVYNETNGEYTLESEHYRTRDIATFKHHDPNCKNKENDGIFTKSIHNFVTNKQRCPFCSESSVGIRNSKGILKIKKYLEDHNFEFESEYKFEGCRSEDHNKLLPFDIYIPDMNTLIEYDGEQHFKPIEVFGGEKWYKMCVKNDNIKNEYAKNNGINLIRIPYTDFYKIDDILDEKLK